MKVLHSSLGVVLGLSQMMAVSSAAGATLPEPIRLSIQRGETPVRPTLTRVAGETPAAPAPSEPEVAPPLSPEAPVPEAPALPAPTPQSPVVATVAEPAPKILSTSVDLGLASGLVDQWARAWSEKRVEDYLSYYAPEFVVPNGATRAAWEALRKKRIEEPRSIEITISSLEVEDLGEGRASAAFIQSYRSDTFADSVHKKLMLVWREGAFKIIEEKLRSEAEPR